MLTRRILLLCAASLCVSSMAVAGTARADDAAALAFVKAIYDSYTKPHSDGVLIDNGKKLRRYFEPTLAAAMNRVSRTQRDTATSANSTAIRSSTPRTGSSRASTSP
jgi:hypothetical protein